MRKTIRKGTELTIATRNMRSNRPVSGMYRMVVPETVEQMDALSGKSQAMRNHVQDMKENKASVFFVCPSDEQDDTVLAAALCRMGEEATFSYMLKHGVNNNESLKRFERQCVEHSVKSMMDAKHVKRASFSKSLAAYNTLNMDVVEA